MKVLILDFDLFTQINENKKTYRKLIRKNPHISFFYYQDQEKDNIYRSRNSFLIKFINYSQSFSNNSYSEQIKDLYILANKMAKSVEGEFFDIIEIPDFCTCGVFIRAALGKYNVKFKRIVLSLKDNFLITKESYWGHEDDSALNELNDLKKLNYLSADVRYSYNKRLLNKLEVKTNINGQYVSPFYFIEKSLPINYKSSGVKPTICFLGPLDRESQVNIFVDFLWMLGSSFYNEAIIFESNFANEDIMRSSDILKKVATNRSVKVKFLSKLDEIKTLISDKVLLFFPFRDDYCDLIALKAFLLGCPIVFDKRSFFVDIIKEKLPGVELITIDSKDIFSSLSKIKEVLLNYDLYRKKLIESLNKIKISSPFFSFENIYFSSKTKDNNALIQTQKIFDELMKTEEINKSIIFSLQQLLPRWLKANIRKGLKLFSIEFYKTRFFGIIYNNQFKNKLYKFLKYYFRIKRTLKLNEHDKQQINEKLKILLNLVNYNTMYRVKLYNEIARLERLLNNTLNACVYDLRVIRLLGRDKYNRLPLILRDLKQLGFTKEAKIAKVLYEDDVEKKENCLRIMNDAYKQHHKLNVNYEYEFLDDTRTKNKYRVSIIVSLYNAAERIEFFLKSISHQSLFKNKEVELIFVETGSTKNDYEVFKQVVKTIDIPTVYARTTKRETIQSAWNRGISLSTSSYLCFLGVDEMILPETLEILSNELDKDPSTDWIQSDAIITEVDNEGSWKKDILVFDRKGYKQELFYLDTCYLVWVGALYRKSIHERFGYYDPTFKAAGDSEFKNRIMPYIKTKYYPKILGLYWHYPEGQASFSQTGEIEDLRAWYLYKTLAGVEYSFNKMPLKKLENIFYDAMNYRKTFAAYEHTSTDIEYAKILLEHIEEKYPESEVMNYSKKIRSYLKFFRIIEEKINIFQSFELVKILSDKNIDKGITGNIKIFNDNRYLNHTFTWGLERYKIKKEL